MSAKRRSNRRQFLSGQSAADALLDLTQGAEGVSATSSSLPSSARDYLVQVGRRAMACQFEVYCNAAQYPQATEVAMACLDLVDALEQQMTVYRDSSEVAAINRNAAEQPVAVEPRLFELLRTAWRIHQETQRAYDITSGPLSKVWGFYRRQGSIPAEQDLRKALNLVGSQHLQLDDETHSVRFAIPSMELNLGSIGKGYALDRCAELMTAEGIGDFLWHGGRSSLLARGSRAADATGAGWPVEIADPLRPGKIIERIQLRDRALGTSGSGTQFFRHRGRRYGHILDPRTGQPADGMLSATVIAATAAEADALSTAFYVLGVEGATAYCQRRPEIAALLVAPATNASGMACIRVNWDSVESAGPKASPNR